jgi:pimeloyl-ACP methyl ester carboxylesterase
MASCQKEKITLGTHVSETFYLDNANESMRILVDGNTLSKTFLIMVHGGPGVGSFAYKTDYISQHIGDKYAIVYWDQRNAGSSQGNSNGSSLNLPQMTEDLKKVIQLIKNRYGENSSVFILGHSFGGLLVSSFMTTDDYQAMVKGWIFVDGSQNYPWNDTLTRQMLLTVGEQQIALNKHTAEWNTIVAYCKAHPGNFTLEESGQLESYATDAETYFDQVHQFDYIAATEDDLVKDNLPLTSILLNYLYSGNASFNKVLAKTEFSTSLYKIVTPTLILFGEYDFICPRELGYEIMNRISTTDKKMVISPISGHDLMFQDEVLYCDEVNTFIAQYK